MVCFRYVILNSLHKGGNKDDEDDDNDDDDDNNNNNNNNKAFTEGLSAVVCGNHVLHIFQQVIFICGNT